MTGLCECHGHIFMDGEDYRAARDRHKEGVDDAAVREHLGMLQQAGVTYFRDGGDGLGVSRRARDLAGEYGIEYATPLFAIHRKGRYGGIVGRGYETPDEYRRLVREAKAQGADFIKVMFSGILRFDEREPLSCPSLEGEEIRALVDFAHENGLAVMAHVNGADAVLSAVLAGTDSIEHGYYTDEACLEAMAAHGCVWVPTLAAVAAFVGRPGYDAGTVERILAGQLQQVRRASDLGVPVASGSDAGAVGVPHGRGLLHELSLLDRAGLTPDAIRAANEKLRRRFRAER